MFRVFLRPFLHVYFVKTTDMTIRYWQTKSYSITVSCLATGLLTALEMEIFFTVCLILALNTFGSSAEKTCELRETKYGIQKITPEGKTSFKVGETLQITCSERYRFFITKEAVRTFTCQNDGEWDKNPRCEEIRCNILQDDRLSYPTFYFRGNMKLGEKIAYRCLPGYRQTANMATCTEDGWKPDPLCADACLTPLLTINNATLLHETRNKSIYSSGEKVRYSCNDGFTFMGEATAKCVGETWNYPRCIWVNECFKPTRNFMTTLSDKNTYGNFETLRYSCISPYNEIAEGAFMCQEGTWHGRFVCTSQICPPPPYLENGDYIIRKQNNDVITEVSYACQSFYVLNRQQEYYKCHNGRWGTPPKCLKPCEITPEISTEYNLKPIPDKYVKHSDRDLRLDCNPGRNVGYWRRPYLKVSCSDGQLEIKTSCESKTFPEFLDMNK